MQETCENCGDPISISVFKGTGHCSENCRKALEELKEKLQEKPANDEQCKWAEWCQDPADPCGYCRPHCEWVTKREEEMASG